MPRLASNNNSEGRIKNRQILWDKLDKFVKIRDTFFEKFNVEIRHNKYRLENGKILSWNNVFKYTTPEFHREYNALRKIIVDGILNVLSEQFNCVKDINNLNENTYCGTVMSGSVNIKSDYDVTIYGPLSGKIIKEFYNIFGELFLDGSDVIFDTNLYGVAYIEPYKLINKTRMDDTNLYQLTQCVNEKCMFKTFKHIPITEKSIIRDQRVWALVKFIQFCPYNYKKLEQYDKLTPDLKELFRKSQELFEKLSTIEDEHKKYVYYIEKSNYLKNVMEKSFGENKNDKAHSYKSNVKRDYFNNVASANYFADDAYYTQGAFNHIVGGQMGGSLSSITTDNYIDSFIENMSFILKTSQKFDLDNKDCFNEVVYISKYYYRAYEALTRAYDSLGKKLSISNKELEYYKRITEISKYIAQNFRNKTQYDEQKSLEYYTLFKGFIETCNTIMKRVSEQVLYHLIQLSDI
jgi:hypothetical protein